MFDYLVSKYLLNGFAKFILFFLLIFLFLFNPFNKSFGEENVFTINNIKVEGPVDVNFSREKYLNRAFLNSFKILMNKILLTRDFKKIDNVKLNQIKNLITKFQILEESYKEDVYRAQIKILYNEEKIRKFLGEQNISFSVSDNISAVFYPVFFDEEELQNFDENFFYTQWQNVEIKNELINFILPLEDLEDISEIIKMKNNIENLNIKPLVNKYNEKNYVFALIDHKDKNLHVYLKTNFKNNKLSKNFSYTIQDVRNEEELNAISKDLKLKITDLWKEQNVVNLLMPLSLSFHFKYSKLNDLDKLRNTFDKVSIINNYTLEEFNINNSFFKIYYYGNPKKLRSELSKFGYMLMNNQGVWHLILNE